MIGYGNKKEMNKCLDRIDKLMDENAKLYDKIKSNNCKIHDLRGHIGYVLNGPYYDENDFVERKES